MILDDKIDDVIKEYNSGKSGTQVALIFGVTQRTVFNALERHGIPRRSATLHMSTDRNPTKGKGHTDEAKQKIREANERQFSNPENRRKHAELTAIQISEGRTGKSFNKLETKVAEQLKIQGINFHWQYRLGKYVFDFYLPDTNTLLEVHGTFWHADPRVYDYNKLTPIQIKNLANDINKAKYALSKGYKLEIMREYDVHRTNIR